MLCVRHHTFIDQKYFVFLFQDRIGIGKSETNLKYELRISQEETIAWKQDFDLRLRGFEIQTRGKIKWFDMSHELTLKLIESLNGRIVYGNISFFYKSHYIIGSGNFSKVIKVYNYFDKQFYACKVLKYKKFDDFSNELSVLTSLNHPNIIKVKQMFKDGDQLCLITDLVEGGTLKEYLDKLEGITKLEIYIIMIQILSAVQYLHSLGYVHRDIKPENILLSEFKNITQLYLIDFGLTAKKEEIATRYPNCGTPGYIAPEVINFDPQRPYDELSDIFSCGVLLYKIIFGRDLFDGSYYSEVFVQNQQFRSEQESFEQNEFGPLLLKMLKESPQERVNASQALQMLEDIVHRKSISSKEFIDDSVERRQQIKTLKIHRMSEKI